jgi:hypothetical protein
MTTADALMTLHTPAMAKGCVVLDAFGVAIARASDPVLALAMAQLINRGAEATRRLRPKRRLARSLGAVPAQVAGIATP